MVIGQFQGIGAPLPMVPALITWNNSIQVPFFVLDTGFSGDIAITEEMAEDLGVRFDTTVCMQAATGEARLFPATTVFATMEGKTLYVTAVLVKGKPLLGITFMQKFNYVAIVDCRLKTVSLSVSVV